MVNFILWVAVVSAIPLLVTGLLLHTFFRSSRKCPLCTEFVKADAKKCKHCGSELPTRHLTV